MITADMLATQLAAFLGQEVQSAVADQRITLLTPAEYPDCDAVAVHVEQDAEGRYVVSDMAAADSMLVGYLSARSADNRAEGIAKRFDVDFDRGRVIARSDAEGLPETCWRVAQASATIAEAITFTAPQAMPRPSFDTLVFDAFARRGIKVARDQPIVGLSGHEHRTSLFVPEVEAVVEPIPGRKAWGRATKVYAEFGDLRQVNGYRLLAVLDDRDARLEQEANLLTQVGQVGHWSRHDEWISALMFGEHPRA